MCSLWNGPAKDPKSKGHSRRMFGVVSQRSRKIKVPPFAALPISQLLQAQGQVDGGSSKRSQVFTKGHRPENDSQVSSRVWSHQICFPTLRLLELQAFVASSISWISGVYVMKWSWKRSCVRARSFAWRTSWRLDQVLPGPSPGGLLKWEVIERACLKLNTCCLWRLGIRPCMYIIYIYTLFYAFRSII